MKIAIRKKDGSWIAYYLIYDLQLKIDDCISSIGDSPEKAIGDLVLSLAEHNVTVSGKVQIIYT